jgi:hypothetical protein
MASVLVPMAEVAQRRGCAAFGTCTACPLGTERVHPPPALPTMTMPDAGHTSRCAGGYIRAPGAHMAPGVLRKCLGCSTWSINSKIRPRPFKGPSIKKVDASLGVGGSGGPKKKATSGKKNLVF